MTGTPGKPGAGGAGMSTPFQQRDTNKDGKLSRDELPGGLFERLDVDKDGVISEAELTGMALS
jgi:Ca2+-binding EF-hand superfamily protein